MPFPPHTASTATNGSDTPPPMSAGVSASVTREFSNVIADAEDLIKATTSLTGDDLVRIRAQLAKGVAAAKVSLDEMGGAVADGARRAGASTDAYVHQQPWKVIGASAAAAFLLGLFIARRG